MLVSYLPFRLAQKHYFSRPAQLPIWRVYVAYTSMHRLRLQLLRFIANNSFAPLRAPTIPPHHHAIPSPLRPCSRALPFLCIPCTGNTAPVSIGPCAACCDVIGIHATYIYIYIYISNGLERFPTNFRFCPSFPSISRCSLVFKGKFREYTSHGIRVGFERL